MDRKHLILVALAIGVFTGCDNHSRNSQLDTDSGSKRTEILLTSQSGGSGAVGLWSILKDDLSLQSTLFETQGLPAPNISQLFSEAGVANIGGKKTGFVYSKANQSFYGVIDKAVIKFDPTANQARILTLIPEFYKSTYYESFSRYVLKPVVSKDGKSLIVIATRGGMALPASPAGDSTRTSGGLVHINIDESSSDFGKANIVFEFFEHSNAVGRDWRDRIFEIMTEPMLYDDGTDPSIFLGSEYVVIDKDMCNQSDNKCTTSGKLFSMHPSDQSDWSKPWQVRGKAVGHLITLGRTPHYDSRENVIWGVGENDYQMSLFKITPDGEAAPDPSSSDGLWSQSRIVWSTTHGTYHPQAVVSGYGDKALVWTTGSVPNSVPEFRHPFLSNIYAHKEPEILQSFQGLWKPDLSGYAKPAHVTVSRNSSTMWVVGNSDADSEDFYQSQMTYLKQTHTYGSAEYSKSLQTLLDEYNVVASYVDEIGTSSLSQQRLLGGDVTGGTFFAGSVAVGDEGSLDSQLYTDGLLFAMATGGGEHGDGALIKYNRNTTEVTRIPLGTNEAGYPVGKAAQVSSSIVIGGTSKVAQAKLKPMETSVGIWSANLQTGELSDERLPGTNVKGVSGDVYLEAATPPLAFVRAGDGDFWANATYWAYDILSFVVNPQTHEEFRAGLIKVDGKTGAIKAGPFITSDGPKYFIGNAITPISGNGEFAMFFEGAGVNDTPSTGQNLFIYDLNNMDSTNYKKIAFSPDNGGQSSGLWRTRFSPVYDVTSNAWYVITTNNVSTNEINIVKLSASTDIMTDPVVAKVNVSWPQGMPVNENDYIATSMFVGSDHALYFGTSDGKLMRFSPGTTAVEVAYDFAPASGSAKLHGFLNEKEGAIVGLIVDSTDEVLGSGMRMFAYDLDSGTANTVNADGIAGSDDPYPGLNLIRR
ncbi:TPA: hypothetical protein I7686_00805 [Vibrio vulnificus]|uniref:hypothetical protein n=1 Tax=Vibrio vulnificus TaxID=672 RepID=UPI001A311A01|nr:hypothetical protein [Vibrio vulnificus]EJU9785387.1 hypothetical protein [Vibrio vulnificus]MCA3988748.1 hypothetical protein [Vibrio vulnificus]HAS8250980.1 hypothetical protein [Vibrio vulnificus]